MSCVHRHRKLPADIRFRSVACAIGILLAGPLTTSSRAQEYIRAMSAAPESVQEIDTPIGIAFKEFVPAPVKDAVEDVARPGPRPDPFWDNAQLDLQLRAYYFLRDREDELADTLHLPRESEALAAGGLIAVRSGWFRESMALAAEVFTSQPISAPDSKPGSLLLKPNQNQISVLGTANIQLRKGQQLVTLYRQRYDLPYLNGNDSRMIPITFEGYSIDGHWPYGRYVAGYVRQFKPRASDKFIPMSHGLGVTDKDKGLAMLGVRYEQGDTFSWGLIGSVVPDVLSTLYSELDAVWATGDLGARFGAQFTDQRSVGDELLTGESFDTQAGGLRIALSYRGAVFKAGLTAVSDKARIRSAFGGDPSFNSLMLSDFNLPNQKAVKVGLSYDFGRVGMPGFSGILNYARGYDARNPVTGASLDDDEEFDVTLDFRPRQAPWKGSWLRLRTAYLNPGTDREIVDVRLIVNWDFAPL